MKNIVLFIFCSQAVLSYSQDDFGEKNEESGYAYRVISDQFDEKIPKGMYVLEGKVLNETNNKTINLVTMTYSDDYLGKTGKKGWFALKIDRSKQQICFTKNGYKRSYFESYEIKEQHRIRIEIRLIKEEKEKHYTEEKPVVYCYSDQTREVSLKLDPSGELSFSYPEFSAENTWNFTVSANHLLQTAEGKEVPYLFWESVSTQEIKSRGSKNQFEGQLVLRENVISFLDSCLTVLNFNASEKTDFITYWGPRLVAEPFCVIQFFQDRECEQFAQYEVSPQPEAFYRLFMVFSTSKTYPSDLNLKKQELIPMKRSGFHLLEWGGIEQQKENIQAD